jgi:hypothetical protein
MRDFVVLAMESQADSGIFNIGECDGERIFGLT